MSGLQWVLHNWDSFLSSVGIIGSLLFTAFSLRSEARTRRVANLLKVTTNHREIWTQFYDHPELSRILAAKPRIRKKPVTESEEVFVTTVILHLASVFHALEQDLVIKEEGLRRDVKSFFSRPIPSAVWEKVKVLHNDEFVDYVESCRNTESYH